MSVLQFDTIAALLDYVETLPWNPKGDESAKGGDDSIRFDFYGGCHATALRLARYGWPEGAAIASEKAARIANRVVEATGASTYLAVEYDVIGAAYDAGAVALGIPEAWGVLAPQEAKRAIRIVSNLGVSCGVGTNAIMHRGIAVAALAMALTSRGYPVTIDLYAANGGCPNWALVRIADAATGSQLDVDRIVYALAHPTFPRKLVRAANSGYRNGYSGDVWGAGAANADMKPPGEIDLFLGGMLYSQANRWQDGGEAWILQEYLRQTGA